MFGEAKKSWKLWKLPFGLLMFVFVACQPPAEESSEDDTQSSEKPKCDLSAKGTLQKDVVKEAKIICTNIGSFYQGKKLKVQYNKGLVSIKVYKEDGKVDSAAETGSLILILDKKSDFEKKVQVKGLKLGSSKVSGKVLSARFSAEIKVVPASLSSPSSPSDSPSGSPSYPSSPSDSPSGSAPSSPSQPTAVKASATTITVSWNGVSGATSYEVYSDTSSIGSFSSKVATVNSGTTYTDTAPRGATYYYKVKACNASGCSSFSVVSAGVNLPGAVSKPNAPSKPTAVKASATTITVSWSAKTGATSYEVHRDTSGGGAFSSKVGTVNSGTSYTDTAPRGSTYYYKVKACNAAGCSSLSVASAGVNPGAVSKPNAPSKPAAVKASATTITVSWSGVSGATSYEVYSDTSDGGSFSSKVATVNSGTSYTDTAPRGSTYYYKVKACNASGCSSLSVASAGVNLPGAVSKPSVPTINVSILGADDSSAGKVRIDWDSITGATSYNVYRSTSASSGFSKISTETTSGMTDTTAGVNTTYYYKINACNTAGCSADSAVKSIKSAPPKPAPLTLSIRDDGSHKGKVVFSWSLAAQGRQYHVYRDTSSDVTDSDTKIATYPNIPRASSRKRTDGTSSSNQKYYYRMKVCNSGGSCSWSDTASITTPPSPVSISLSTLSSGADKGRVRVTWSGVSGASKYHIYRDTSRTVTDSDTKVSTETSPNVTDTSASGNTKYYYRVQTCNSSNCSWSNTPSITTPNYPSAPGFAKKSGDYYRWGPVSSASYQLLKSDGSIINHGTVALFSPRTYTSVRACNSNGCSAWVNF